MKTSLHEFFGKSKFSESLIHPKYLQKCPQILKVGWRLKIELEVPYMPLVQ